MRMNKPLTKVVRAPVGPQPFTENDPNLRVYGPSGEVDPVEALRKQHRHLMVRDLKQRGKTNSRIALELGITEEDVEESLSGPPLEGAPIRGRQANTRLPNLRPGSTHPPRPQ